MARADFGLPPACVRGEVRALECFPCLGHRAPRGRIGSTVDASRLGRSRQPVGCQLASTAGTRETSLELVEPRRDPGEADASVLDPGGVARRSRGFAQVRGRPDGDAAEPHRLHSVLGGSHPVDAAFGQRQRFERSMAPQLAFRRGDVDWADELGTRRGVQELERPCETGVDDVEPAFGDVQRQRVGEPVELGPPTGRHAGHGLLRPGPGQLPAPHGVGAGGPIEPDVVAVGVLHPELVAHPDALCGRFDGLAADAAVVQRLDKVHVCPADVVRRPGLASDLERVADRDHSVGAGRRAA